MKKLFLLPVLLCHLSFSQNTQLSTNNKPQTTNPVNVFLNASLFADSIVHIVWENHDENNVKEVILESSVDGINFTMLSTAAVSSLTDIHSNNYPKWIDYYNHILKSSESGNYRYIYNEIISGKSNSEKAKWYRVKMLDNSGKTYISQAANSIEQTKNITPVKTEKKITIKKKRVLKDGGKPGCKPLGMPTGNPVYPLQTQTFYGQCCYWVETLYRAPDSLQIPCFSNYGWCCNNVPEAPGCSSGYAIDPCCDHDCYQYYLCSCAPWQCCPLSQVQQWVVTQSIDMVPITLTPIIQNETSAGMNDGSITITVNNGTAPITYKWSNGDSTSIITGLSAGTYIVTVTDVNNCQSTTIYTVKIGTGIADITTMSTITISPSPVQNTLYIYSNLPIQQVEITDILGNLIIRTTEKIIPFALYSKGIYFIKIITPKGTVERKFVKE